MHSISGSQPNGADQHQDLQPIDPGEMAPPVYAGSLSRSDLEQHVRRGPEFPHKDLVIDYIQNPREDCPLDFAEMRVKGPLMYVDGVRHGNNFGLWETTLVGGQEEGGFADFSFIWDSDNYGSQTVRDLGVQIGETMHAQRLAMYAERAEEETGEIDPTTQNFCMAFSPRAPESLDTKEQLQRALFKHTALWFGALHGRSYTETFNAIHHWYHRNKSDQREIDNALIQMFREIKELAYPENGIENQQDPHLKSNLVVVRPGLSISSLGLPDRGKTTNSLIIYYTLRRLKSSPSHNLLPHLNVHLQEADMYASDVMTRAVLDPKRAMTEDAYRFVQTFRPYVNVLDLPPPLMTKLLSHALELPSGGQDLINYIKRENGVSRSLCIRDAGGFAPDNWHEETPRWPLGMSSMEALTALMSDAILYQTYPRSPGDVEPTPLVHTPYAHRYNPRAQENRPPRAERFERYLSLMKLRRSDIIYPRGNPLWGVKSWKGKNLATTMNNLYIPAYDFNAAILVHDFIDIAVDAYEKKRRTMQEIVNRAHGEFAVTFDIDVLERFGMSKKVIAAASDLYRAMAKGAAPSLSLDPRIMNDLSAVHKTIGDLPEVILE